MTFTSIFWLALFYRACEKRKTVVGIKGIEYQDIQSIQRQRMTENFSILPLDYNYWWYLGIFLLLIVLPQRLFRQDRSLWNGFLALVMLIYYLHNIPNLLSFTPFWLPLLLVGIALHIPLEIWRGIQLRKNRASYLRLSRNRRPHTKTIVSSFSSGPDFSNTGTTSSRGYRNHIKAFTSVVRNPEPLPNRSGSCYVNEYQYFHR